MNQLPAASKVISCVRSAVLARVAGSALLAAAVIAVPSAPALADPAPPASAAPVRAQGERLEKLFQTELKRLEAEEKQLARAGEVAARVQEKIDNLKSRGRDTSELEAALAGFKAGVAEAQSFHDTAKGILDARAGFDSNGKVTDTEKARQTVRTAGKAERQFYQTMRKALRELRREAREYRKDNGPRPQRPEREAEKRAKTAVPART